MNESKTDASENLALEHGLSSDEYALILNILNRAPSPTEVGIFSSMWSEHCSYKSSKKWLKTLPTAGPKLYRAQEKMLGLLQ